MPKVALVRGNGLTKYELQYYVPLMTSFQITGICAKNNIALVNDLPIPVRKILTIYDFERFIPNFLKLRKIYKEVLYWQLFYEKMFGLEKILSEFDIVHSSDLVYFYTFQCARAKLRYGNKLVITHWQNIPFAYGFRWINFVRSERYKVLKSAVDVVIAKSERARFSLILEGFPADKITVIYPGVDLERFKPSEKDPQLLEKFGLNDADKIILFSGRLHWHKGVEVLINAFKLLCDDLKSLSIKLLIVGSGPLEARLRKLVKFFKLDKKIIFVGGVNYDEMPKFHNLADVFVLPSVPGSRWQEQFGMVLIESMACRKPVVTTLSGSIAEVVENCALLVQPFDFYDLYRGLKKVLIDKHYADELAEMGRNLALKKFDARKTSERIKKIYDDLLK